MPDENETKVDSQGTEILYKPEEILRKSLRVVTDAKEQVDSCLDQYGPSMLLKIESAYPHLKDSIARGCRYRIVTEITRKNLSDCMELMKIVRLRHMEGIKGNFNIADRKIYGGGGGADTGEGKFPSQYIFSNVSAFVE